MSEGLGVLEVLGLILGSEVLVKLVELIADRLKRKDKVADSKDMTWAQIQKLREETSEQIQELRKESSRQQEATLTICNDVKLVMHSQKAIAYDRIRHLSMSYIKRGTVTVSEIRNLIDMFRAYDAIDPDEPFLRHLMKTVEERCKTVPDEGG